MAATKRAVDFTNVKDQGQFQPKRVPAGEYRAKITAVNDHQSDADKNMWVFTIVLNKHQRASYPYYCGSTEKQAWKIRNLCVAAGIAVPKKRVMIDPNKLVGKEVGVEIDDDEYEGKPKSVLSAFFPVSELTSDSPKGSKSSTVDDDDEEDVEEDEDLDEIDLDEI
jgi:hypothetical protein